jgi:hypothetical protein
MMKRLVVDGQVNFAIVVKYISDVNLLIARKINLFHE